MEEMLTTGRATLLALLPIAAFFLALSAITKRGSLARAWRTARPEAATNCGLYILNYVILAPLFILAARAVADVVPGIEALTAHWNALPEPVAVLGAIVAIDVVAYWRHRLGHTRAIWRWHATHHADEALNWFSVTRKHPVDKLLEMTLDSILALALGVPVWAIVVANIVRGWWGYFIHADVPWTLGPLRRVLVSPAAHRLHHARDEALMGTNFANTFAFIDLVFGTFADPAPHVNCATGIAEGTRGTLGELARPWEARYRKPGAQPEDMAAA